jgi:hypothetical protein
MRCRHTVADWHRFVAASEEAPPIYAACRLLIREGQPAADPRTIACGFWGRQEHCPVYEGPRAAQVESPARAADRRAAASAETRVALDAVWPVRGPGEPDRVGLALTALRLAVILALAATAGVIIATGLPGRPWLLAVIGISLATHILSALRAWAGR